ncbi:MAG: VCBS repeat-containing protein [Planctomycetota bacterium]|nr:VCBS repeat-containing protein [Planctomycetota bacterium]
MIQKSNLRVPSWVVLLSVLFACSWIAYNSGTDLDSFVLLEPTSMEGFSSVIQRCGVIPPQGIVDVKSTGLALLDIDSDGRTEILLTSGSTSARFQMQKAGFPSFWFRQAEGHDFKVEPIADISQFPPMKWSCGVAAADLDGDGDDDLLLTGIGELQLLENIDGRWNPVTDSGLSAEGWCTSAAFGDLDLDGDLDLYVCRYLDYDFESPPRHGAEWSCLWENRPVLCGPRGLPALPDLVFENLGGLKFQEVTQQWGFTPDSTGYGLAVTIIDLYGDPHPEIFVANDSCPNHLWSYSQSRRWSEDGLLSGIAVDEDGQEQAGMGIGVGDLDADGKLDLVVTNFERESLNLYINQGDGTFRDEAATRGLAAASRPMLSWGVAVADLDLDGLADLFVANGHVYPEADQVPSSAGYQQSDQYWLARRSGDRVRFEEQIDESLRQQKHLGRCAALCDLDRDGDLDVLSTSLNGAPHLLINHASETASSIRVRLQQDGLNRQGIGASVGLRNEGRWIPYPVLRQSSFQTSSEAEVILATDWIAGSGLLQLEVRWPDGKRESFSVGRKGLFTLHRGSGVIR